MLSLVLFLAFSATATKKQYCQRGDLSCWPTAQDVEDLTALLDPDAKRVLKWDGQPNPRVSSVPIGSQGDQPLYGIGTGFLKALYYDGEDPFGEQCFTGQDEELREICYASIRNNPLEKYQPGFVVFALTAEHVQAAVKFAVKHNLCVMVAGTGHDFINRHSCSDGVFIRTTLMQSAEFDLTDEKGFGWEDGNVRFGPGLVFSQAHKLASEQGRYVSSGWAITVGIAGWSIGGGHGPFANSAGLGVDNILELDIVTADGSLVTANAKQNSDLFWALRGGGGSTWGVITAYTLRTHKIPEGGFTMIRAIWSDDFCSRDKLETLTEEYLKWTLQNDKRWSGLAFHVLTKDPLQGTRKCQKTAWFKLMQYVFLGSPTEAKADWDRLAAKTTWAGVGPANWAVQDNNLSPEPGREVQLQGFETYWEAVNSADKYALETISPIVNDPEGVSASVLISREVTENGEMLEQLKAGMDACEEAETQEGNCHSIQLYNAITGAKDSYQNPNTSVSPGLRTGLFHAVIGNSGTSGLLPSYYKMGPYSYQAEASMSVLGASWEEKLDRFWGRKNYAKLLAIKKKWDPENVFWCEQCVGSEMVDDYGAVGCGQCHNGPQEQDPTDCDHSHEDSDEDARKKLGSIHSEIHYVR